MILSINMVQKKRPRLNRFHTVVALAVNLQPVAAQLKLVGGGHGLKQVFDVTAQKILRRAALNTQKVVMVAPVTELVV